MSSKRISRKNWTKLYALVFVKCPKCEQITSLECKIDSSGNVTPSFDCPFCEFHEKVVLEEWNGKAT